MGLEVIAGSIATIVFASSTMPMLLKAWRSKDVKSYSLLNIILANIGNLFYSIYVLHLPLGPVWALHLFQCCSTGLSSIGTCATCSWARRSEVGVMLPWLQPSCPLICRPHSGGVDHQTQFEGFRLWATSRTYVR